MFKIILFLFSLLVLLFSIPSHAKTGGHYLEKRMSQAKLKEKEGDYEAAAAIYESLLKKIPDHEQALLELGRVQYWQGHYQESIDTYKKILDRQPYHVDALVGSGKAFLALGEEKKAGHYFTLAKKEDPENKEVEAIEPQLKKETKIRIMGGYITENPNYALQTQGEYQEIRVVKEKSYGFGLNSSYLRKFERDTYNTELLGNYYFLTDTWINAGISFSPKALIVPRQSYTIGLGHHFGVLAPEVHYLFQDYAQANIHHLEWGLYFEPNPWIRLGSGYQFQNLRFGGTSQNFHGAFGIAKIGTPFQWLYFDLFYRYKEIGFEAGRPSTPFLNTTAHFGGGAVNLDFIASYSMRFEVFHENRSNGETSETYILSGGISL